MILDFLCEHCCLPLISVFQKADLGILLYTPVLPSPERTSRILSAVLACYQLSSFVGQTLDRHVDDSVCCHLHSLFHDWGHSWEDVLLLLPGDSLGLLLQSSALSGWSLLLVSHFLLELLEQACSKCAIHYHESPVFILVKKKLPSVTKRKTTEMAPPCTS